MAVASSITLLMEMYGVSVGLPAGRISYPGAYSLEQRHCKACPPLPQGLGRLGSQDPDCFCRVRKVPHVASAAPGNGGISRLSAGGRR